MGNLEVMEDLFDENDEPTDAEIESYARVLGFKIPADKHLLYIAKEGLKAPMPK